MIKKFIFHLAFLTTYLLEAAVFILKMKTSSIFSCSDISSISSILASSVLPDFLIRFAILFTAHIYLRSKVIIAGLGNAVSGNMKNSLKAIDSFF